MIYKDRPIENHWPDMCTYFMLRCLITNKAYLPTEERRKRFQRYATIYIIVFLILGFLFMGLYFHKSPEIAIYLYFSIVCFSYSVAEIIISVVLFKNNRRLIDSDKVLINKAEIEMVNSKLGTPFARPFSYSTYLS